MALFNDVSAMVQASRPKQMGPNAGGQSLHIENSEEGYGKIGLNLGKGLGADLKDQYDPDKVREQAKQTYELMAKMPDELKAQIYANPDVQEKFKNYYRLMPQMFADAGFVTGDVNLKGKLAFVGDESVSSSIASTKAGTEQKQAETKKATSFTEGQDLKNEIDRLTKISTIAAANLEPIKARALMEQAQQMTKASVQKMEQEAKNAPLEKDKLRAEIQSSRASSAYNTARALAEPQAARDESEYKKALALQATAHAKYYQDALAQARLAAKESPEVKRAFDMTMHQVDKIQSEYGSDLPRKRPEYSIRVASVVSSNIVSGMGDEQFVTKDGRAPISLPAMLKNHAAKGMYNNALDNIYQVMEDKKELLTKDRTRSLYLAAKNLYDSVHGKLDNLPLLNPIDENIIRSGLDKRARAKMYYMQYLNEMANGRFQNNKWRDLTPAEIKEYREEIMKAGGFPTPMDGTNFWDSFFSRSLTEESTNLGKGMLMESGIGD